MPLRMMVIDFNSYFASVEQQERTELRGRPVAVLPVMTDSTSCIAVSYEAKRFGVKTGTNAAEARKLCPALVVLEARPDLYVKYHHRLIAAVNSCLPVTQVLSIDEMSCALAGRWQERETALRLAREIKERIAATVGECMKSSIGIAPNGFLAKTASDMEKPNGLVVLEEKDLPEALFGLELRDFCGIGEARETRLHACGVLTVEQLCRAPKSLLHRAWHGIEGDRIYALLRGEVVERRPTTRCTVGHSHVLEPKYRTAALAEAVLHRLLQKAAARLRSLGYLAGTLGVSVEFLGNRGWSDEMSFLETQDTLEFIRVFGLLWRRLPPGAPPPMAVGVVFFNLTATTNATPHLPQMERSRTALDHAMDRLNLCYGKNTVYFGGAQTALDSSPARIAFTHVPEQEKERVEVGGMESNMSRAKVRGVKKNLRGSRHRPCAGTGPSAGRLEQTIEKVGAILDARAQSVARAHATAPAQGLGRPPS